MFISGLLSASTATMSMITSATWVPRGFAAPFPQKYNFDEEEFERIAQLAKLQLDDANEELEEAQANANDGEAEPSDAPVSTKKSKKSKKSESKPEEDEDEYGSQPRSCDYLLIRTTASK